MNVLELAQTVECPKCDGEVYFHADADEPIAECLSCGFYWHLEVIPVDPMEEAWEYADLWYSDRGERECRGT